MLRNQGMVALCLSIAACAQPPVIDNEMKRIDGFSEFGVGDIPVFILKKGLFGQMRVSIHGQKENH